MNIRACYIGIDNENISLPANLRIPMCQNFMPLKTKRKTPKNMLLYSIHGFLRTGTRDYQIQPFLEAPQAADFQVSDFFSTGSSLLTSNLVGRGSHERHQIPR